MQPALRTTARRRAAGLPLTAWQCASCQQRRDAGDRRGDVCMECADDAADAEALAGSLPANVSRAKVRAHLLQLAGALERQPPFTRLGFAVLARKVLAWLQVVHRRLDVQYLEPELTTWMASLEDNGRELATFIRCELALPTLATTREAKRA